LILHETEDDARGRLETPSKSRQSAKVGGLRPKFQTMVDFYQKTEPEAQVNQFSSIAVLHGQSTRDQQLDLAQVAISIQRLQETRPECLQPGEARELLSWPFYLNVLRRLLLESGVGSSIFWFQVAQQ
jgi:hypothetical protein